MVPHMKNKNILELWFYLESVSTDLINAQFNAHRIFSNAPKLLIDMEYPGLEAVIKQRLYNLFRRAGIRLNPNQIAFGFIGKKSAAHRIALATFQRKQLPDLILAVEDVLSEF